MLKLVERSNGKRRSMLAESSSVAKGAMTIRLWLSFNSIGNTGFEHPIKNTVVNSVRKTKTTIFFIIENSYKFYDFQIIARLNFYVNT